MKKFITNNIAIFVIIAICLAGFAIYRVSKSSESGTDVEKKAA